MSLVLPLRRLVPPPPPLARTLHLDPPAALDAWRARVRDADEACLLVDASGRVAAMSRSCSAALGFAPGATTGALLVDLVTMVDFTRAGLPVDDPEVQAPPLRSLASGRLTRGLVRLREGTATRTYDVVGVPLSGGVGALGFVAPA